MKMILAILGCLTFVSSSSFADDDKGASKLNSITCWDVDGSKKVVDTYKYVSKACEENGYFADKQNLLDCAPIIGQVLIENYNGDPITYTKMVYSCGNLKDSPRKTITCKGKWTGDLKGCIENRFSLSQWIEDSKEKKLKNGDDIKRLRKKIEAGATR